MKNTYLLILSVLSLSTPAFVTAQTLLNGSFENTTGACSYNLTNASFDGMMNDCYAFGSGDQLDILDNSCGFGTAEDGTHFVGLAVDITNTLTDGFSMKLSSPLLAGNIYTLSFYNRKDQGYNANLLEIGYSSDSASFGTAIDTAALPSTSWDFVTMTFTPAINCSYITVRTIAGAYGWNFVDDFTVWDITNTGDPAAGDRMVQVYPNPTSGVVSFATSSACIIESVTVKDIQGKTLLVSRNSSVDITGFPAGVYVFELATNNGRVVKRIVKE
jgi:hypothetical protein